MESSLLEHDVTRLIIHVLKTQICYDNHSIIIHQRSHPPRVFVSVCIDNSETVLFVGVVNNTSVS
jgi:hypothetical protein